MPQRLAFFNCKLVNVCTDCTTKTNVCHTMNFQLVWFFYFSFVLCAICMAITIPELTLPKARINKNCTNLTGFFKDAYILPVGSEFLFKCPFCPSSEKSLESRWLYAPSNSFGITVVTEDENNLIDWNGHLKVQYLKENGTYYCQVDNKVVAIYSVTVLNQVKEKKLKHHLKKILPQNVVEVEGIDLNIVMVNIYSARGVCGVITRTVTQCQILFINSNDLPLSQAYMLKFQLITLVLPCNDYAIVDSISPQYPALQITYRLSTAECSPPEPITNKALEQARMAADQVSYRTLERSIGQDVTFSCLANGFNEYRWVRVESNSCHNSWQLLSPLFVHTRFKESRIRVDFAGNLQIHKLTLRDFDFHYQCFLWDNATLIQSFRLKLKVDTRNFMKLFDMTFNSFSLLCISTVLGLIILTIVWTPNINAKL